MNEKGKSRAPIPDDFDTIEEAAEIWDTHSLDEYWDQTHEVEIGVRAPRHHWVPLAMELSIQMKERARQEGVSVETLVNLWVAERLRMGT